MNQEYMPPSKAGVQNTWSYTLTPPYICLPSRLINLSLCSLKQISYRPTENPLAMLTQLRVFLLIETWVSCSGFCVSAEMSVIGRVYLPAKHLGKHSLPLVMLA